MRKHPWLDRLQSPRMWWLHRLPCNADPIYTEWPIKEGGVCAYAWTDEKGKAFLAIQTLHRLGKTTGLPDWFRRRRFSADMIVGFVGDKPLVIRVQATITAAGLELVVRLPRDIKAARDFVERCFTPWDSGTPSFSIMLSPAFAPRAGKSFPLKTF